MMFSRVRVRVSPREVLCRACAHVRVFLVAEEGQGGGWMHADIVFFSFSSRTDYRMIGLQLERVIARIKIRTDRY